MLVHGMVVAGNGTLPLARELVARGFSVHIPDLPGFGRSEKPRRALDVDGLADSLAGWIATCGLLRAGLLGNSFGTQVAAAVAERLGGGAGPVSLLSPTIDRRFRRGWAERLPPGRPGGGHTRGLPGWLKRQAVDRLVAGDDRAEETSLGRLIVTEYAAAGPPRALSTYRHALRDDIAGRLPLLQSPVLVLRGELDRLVSRNWAASLAELACGSYLEISGVGHDAQYHRPASVADALIDHLTGTPAVTRSGRQ